MSNRCQICDKSKQFGEQSRHHRGVAGKQWLKRAQRTLKVFKPNLQWATIDGLRIKVCSKCRKLLVKDSFVKKTETVVTSAIK